MIELSEDEIKQIQIKLLKELTAYCEKKSLVYFLGYGTLLGAVRHKGFIPWDDDIDVIMPRDDYDKLINEFNIFHEYIKLFDSSIDPTYPYTFVKLSDPSTIIKEEMSAKYNKLGVNIDIFPLDNVPEILSDQTKIMKRIKYYRNILDIKNIKINKKRKLYKNIILILGKILFYFIDYKVLVNKIINISKETKSSGKYTGCLVWNYGEKEVMEKEIFTESIKLEFENILYNAPKNYDKYLKNLYGDYMTFPPSNKRVTHHLFKAYKIKDNK